MSAALLTQRLRLRPLHEDDAAFILELLNDPDFIRQIADRGVRDLPAAREYLRNGPLSSYARHGHGLMCVESRADGTPLGICGLVRRAELEHADLGYALLPAGRGHGFACEAGAAVLAHAWAVLGLERVLAIVNHDNQRSLAVLERLGFRELGIHVPPDAPPEATPLRLLAAQAPGRGYTSGP